MYKIIGADKKTYGPISREQILHWITENRANGDTLVQLEGATDWKPLASFPEFASAFAGSPPPPLSTAAAFQPAGNREDALRAVKSPALALKVTAALGLLAAILSLAWNIATLVGWQFGMNGHYGDPQVQMMISRFGGGFGIFQNVIGMIVSVVLWQGAAKMEALENYQFAFTACILAMVPCVSPCCWLGLPFGIWALTVLNRPEVKSQFSRT